MSKSYKHKKHDSIVNNFDKQKSKQLEKIATKMLKQDELNQKLKKKDIDIDFDLF